VRALDGSTWSDFAALVERIGGVWGGCWRMVFRPEDRTAGRWGVADAAPAGALAEIARHGGGSVESCPEDVEGRSVSASFLHNGTVHLFQRHGFTRTRRLGQNHRVVVRDVTARASPASRPVS
jgi:hypothetical protein